MRIENFDKTKEGSRLTAEAIVRAQERRFTVLVERSGGIGLIDTIVTIPQGTIHNASRYPHGQAPFFDYRGGSTCETTLTMRGAVRRGVRHLNKKFPLS